MDIDIHIMDKELSLYTCGESDVLEENLFYWTVSVTMPLK